MLMFQNYLQLLTDLLHKICQGSNGEVTFMNYLQAVGMGILLLLIVAVIIVGILALFFIPYKGYGLFLKNINQKLDAATKDSDSSVILSLEKIKRRKQLIFWIFFIIVYVPVAIPTVLYIVYLLTNIL